MIGVIAPDNEWIAVREFFQLFKTPWEPYKPGKSYEVVLTSAECQVPNLHATLVLIYSASKLSSDPSDAAPRRSAALPALLKWNDDLIPIYGDCLSFSRKELEFITEESSGKPVAFRLPGPQQHLIRVGYNLFHEVQALLTHGQPAAQAGIPTLDLHIEFLRHLLRSAGITFTEIPPVPCGYQFAVCLTHDVDHPAIRMHRADHTAAGFLFRATVGSVADFLIGRIRIRTLLTNWIAAVKWPLIQLHLAKDLWADFPRQYDNCEGGLSSTYFVIPFKRTAGRTPTGNSHPRRAAAYGARDIEPTIRQLLNNGSEVGLHGIDTWCSREAALREADELRTLTGKSEIGARMHWLFFDEASPQILESAGVSYDSTVGYRETVGFRSGTAQAYVPFGAESLLELPLHAMDVSLFYPAYLGLTSAQATQALAQLVQSAARFGGCLTINWHDRSLSPERLWSSSYLQLLTILKAHKVWFATGSDAAAWFRKRRSAVFEDTSHSPRQASCPIQSDDDALPGLILRTHMANSHNASQQSCSPHVQDAPLTGDTNPLAMHVTAGHHAHTSHSSICESTAKS